MSEKQQIFKTDLDLLTKGLETCNIDGGTSGASKITKFLRKYDLMTDELYIQLRCERYRR